MQLLSFHTPDGLHAGLVRGNGVVDLTDAARRAGADTPTDLLGWVQRGPAAVEQINALAGVDTPVIDRDSVRVAAPFGRPPRNALCVGANYRAHAEESEAVVGPLNLPDDPVFFTKDVRAFCGPYDDLPVDEHLSTQMDWEVELGVVIGRTGRAIGRDQALDHVFGYTIVNDVSFRDVQLQRSQWWMGKSFEASSPYGPVIRTADEITDPQQLQLRCWIDGVLKQDSSSGLMIHSVAELIAEVSRFITLEPGDIVSTGTPAGVALAETPPPWLRPGSVVECEITLLGRQRNLIVADGAAR